MRAWSCRQIELVDCVSIENRNATWRKASKRCDEAIQLEVCTRRLSGEYSCTIERLSNVMDAFTGAAPTDLIDTKWILKGSYRRREEGNYMFVFVQ